MRALQPELPASVAALPFLFVRDRAADDGWKVRAALAAAMAAERADTSRRNSRTRVGYLLCELGFQLARRGADRDALLPLPRTQIADALGTSLSKVKRIVALLALSRIVESDGDNVRVLDWPCLAAIAHFDLRRLEIDGREEADGPHEGGEEPAPAPTTVAGDPACFV